MGQLIYLLYSVMKKLFKILKSIKTNYLMMSSAIDFKQKICHKIFTFKLNEISMQCLIIQQNLDYTIRKLYLARFVATKSYQNI